MARNKKPTGLKKKGVTLVRGKRRTNKFSPLKAREAWLLENKGNNWGVNRPVVVTLATRLMVQHGENGNVTYPVAPLNGFHRGAQTRVARGLYERVVIADKRIPQPLPTPEPKLSTANARNTFVNAEALETFVKFSQTRSRVENADN